MGAVSVIVPTHNRARFLREALLSILAQRYPLIDLIVIANGCQDDTVQVVRDLQAQYPTRSACANSSDSKVSWQFFNFKGTLGGARARNIGLNAAQGEYVAFLDDDDLWHPDKLMTQVRILNSHPCCIVGTDFFYLYGDNRQRPAGRVVRQIAGADDLVGLGFEDISCENRLGSFSLCLTRRSYIGESRINEGLEALQDWDLWLKILKNSSLPARISPFRHVYYRLGDNRLSRRYAHVVIAQRLFLQIWRGVLNRSSINYHNMRTWCYQKKIGKRFMRYLQCILHSSWIVKTIFDSCERDNLKRYLHYLLLPILDIDALRIRLWEQRTQKFFR